MRIHPAASRVEKLAKEIPVVDRVLRSPVRGRSRSARRALPRAARRRSSELLATRRAAAARHAGDRRPRASRLDWFKRFEGAGLDGVMAKPDTGTYQPNKRVMLKVKHERECDCVVAGFRWHKNGAGNCRSARSCSVSTTTRARCSTSASRRASPTRSGASSSRSSRRIRENALASSPVEGLGGTRRARGGDAAQARREEPLERRQGASRGSRCARSSWSRSPTTTCRARASATPRTSVAGARTRSRATARTRSSRSSPPHELADALSGERCSQASKTLSRRAGADAGQERYRPTQPRDRVARGSGRQMTSRGARDRRRNRRRPRPQRSSSNDSSACSGLDLERGPARNARASSSASNYADRAQAEALVGRRPQRRRIGRRQALHWFRHDDFFREARRGS